MAKFKKCLNIFVSLSTIAWSIGLTSLVSFIIMPSAALAATSGPSSGSTFADNAILGTETWSDVGNAASSDDARASVILNNDQTSHYLKAMGFGFSVPANATIDGIEVWVERSASQNNEISDSGVRLVNSGTIIGDNNTAGGKWGNSDATTTYGGPTDLWGTAWTPSDINNAATGVVFSAVHDSNGGPDTARVDHITMTVYYTPYATIPFTEIFGTGSDISDIPNWAQNGDGTKARAATGSGNDSVSPDGGRFALTDGNGGWICRVVDATGFNLLQLSYYWRGDTNANSSDDGIVEYKVGGGCSDTSDWNQLQNHDLSSDTTWTTQSAFSLSGANNSIFSLRFRAASNNASDDFRVDGVEISGNIIDAIPPTLTEVTPVPTPTNNTTPNYTFNSSEAGAIAYGGDCASATAVAVVGDNTITFNPLGAGTHSNCTITVTDAAGNPSAPLSVSSFTLDTAAPLTSALYNEAPLSEPWYTSSPVSASLLADDGSGSGVASTFYILDGGATTTYSGPFNISGDASHSLSYWSVDNAGNVEETQTDTIKIDVTQPSSNSTPPAYDNSGTIQIPYSASDATSGLDTVKLQATSDGGETWQDVDGQLQLYEGANSAPVGVFFTFTPPDEGNYGFKTIAKDMAGNEEIKAGADGWTEYDITAPASAAVTNPEAGEDGWIQGVLAQVDISAIDSPSSGVKSISYLIDGGETMVIESNSASFEVSGEGEHQIEYWTEDNANNIETPHNILNVWLDGTAPEAPLLSAPENNSQTNANPILSWLASNDETSGIMNYFLRIYKDIAEGESYFETDSVDTDYDTAEIGEGGPADGIYYWQVLARDTAENSSDWSELWGFVKDTIAPTTPTAEPAGGDYQNDVVVSLAAEDNYLAAIYYTLDGSEPNSDSTSYNSETKINISADTTLKAIAYDQAGNVSEIMTEIYGIAPVVSEESSKNTGTTSFTATWATDDPATSRVIYDTVSRPILGSAPNYDYANSTIEDDTKVMSHSVVVSELTPNTIYYYRVVSHGSPETVGGEITVTTAAAPTPAPAPTTGGGGSNPSSGLLSINDLQSAVTENNDGTVVISWFTNHAATSRVVYDTVSHSTIGFPPDYGYTFSTLEDSNQVTFHQVPVFGLTPGVTYYFRTISHGSPEIYGQELVYTISETTQPAGVVLGEKTSVPSVEASPATGGNQTVVPLAETSGTVAAAEYEEKLAQADNLNQGAEITTGQNNQGEPAGWQEEQEPQTKPASKPINYGLISFLAVIILVIISVIIYKKKK